LLAHWRKGRYSFPIIYSFQWLTYSDDFQCEILGLYLAERRLLHACLEHYVDIVLRVDFLLIIIPNNTAKQSILQGKAEHLYTQKEDACMHLFGSIYMDVTSLLNGK
jgi:hypothetical protein